MPVYEYKGKSLGGKQVQGELKAKNRAELERLVYLPLSVELGEVELNTDLSEPERSKVSELLQQFGFVLINDRRGRRERDRFSHNG